MPLPLFAAQAEMSADSLEGTGEVFKLEGNVLIRRGDVVIRAERAQYDRSTGDINASSGFVYEDEQMSVSASSAALNLDTGQGTLYNAHVFFKEDGSRISGAEIRRESPERYFIQKGEVTSCEGLPPAWCFRGRDFDVEVGERLVARGVTFRIRNVPVFYTPYAWVPIVTQRRSGLLPPTFGYRDSTGAYYRQPIYWAPVENRDVTLNLDYHSDRAFGQGLEYRYVEGPLHKGDMYGYHLRDSVRKVDFYEGHAFHRAGGETIEGFYDVNFVNRQDYFRIYEPYIEQSARRFLYSRGEVWANLGSSRLYVRSRYYQDMDENVSNREVLQELPGAGLHLAPFGLGPLVLGGEARTSKFRRSIGYEGERTDGVITGMLRLGHGPVLAQSGSLRRVYYSVSDAGNEERFYNTQYEYRAEGLFALRGAFDSVSHVVEPSAYYARRGREGEPPPLLDGTELFDETELVGVNMTNRFLGKKREFVTSRIVQEYNLEENVEDRWLPLVFDLAIKGYLTVETLLAYDHYEERLSRAETRLSLKMGETHLSAGQSYTRELNVEYYRFGVRQELGDAWELGASARYDAAEVNEADKLREVSAVVGYTAQCWGVRLEGIRHPDDSLFYLTVSLAGIGETGSH